MKTLVRILFGLLLVAAVPVGIMQILCKLELTQFQNLLNLNPIVLQIVNPLLPFLWPFIFHICAGLLLFIILRPRKDYMLLMNTKASGILIWVTMSIFLGLSVSKLFVRPASEWWSDWCQLWGLDPLGPMVAAQAASIVFFTIVLVPLAEELFYRVLLFKMIRKIQPPMGALVVTSLIFSMVHCFSVSGGQCLVSPWNLENLTVCLPFGPLVLGLMSQLIWIREQSFTKIWIFHGLCNGMAMFYF